MFEKHSERFRKMMSHLIVNTRSDVEEDIGDTHIRPAVQHQLVHAGISIPDEAENIEEMLPPCEEVEQAKYNEVAVEAEHLYKFQVRNTDDAQDFRYVEVWVAGSGSYTPRRVVFAVRKRIAELPTYYRFACDHDWELQSSSMPRYGIRHYKCSKCGATYTQDSSD